jgi:AmmeMemoRadiSam system protein A
MEPSPSRLSRNDATGRVLLALARESLEAAFRPEETLPPNDAPDFQEIGATFVTLRRGAELRGCIGTIEAYRPLAEDVRANAAFADPRFPPLRQEELGEIRLEVSLLSVPEPLPVASEAEALRRLHPGVDGVVFEFRDQRSTFLPQVWKALPEPRDFLAELKRKAGLPPDFWSPEVRLWTYRVTHWAEP